jgi:NAD-dependent dihydropyrimidine dehydrogenase PreA subunit
MPRTADKILQKKRRAAADPDRPGDRCHAAAGSCTPAVDRTRCEAERDCVDVCPNDVFEVRRIEPDDFAALGVGTKLKVLAHRRLTAYTPNAGACRACGLWVVACPKDAITLVPPDGGAAFSSAGG